MRSHMLHSQADFALDPFVCADFRTEEESDQEVCQRDCSLPQWLLSANYWSISPECLLLVCMLRHTASSMSRLLLEISLQTLGRFHIFLLTCRALLQHGMHAMQSAVVVCADQCVVRSRVKPCCILSADMQPGWCKPVWRRVGDLTVGGDSW